MSSVAGGLALDATGRNQLDQGILDARRLASGRGLLTEFFLQVLLKKNWPDTTQSGSASASARPPRRVFSMRWSRDRIDAPVIA